MERMGVGLLGLGTVGAGVARLLDEAGDRIARRAGRRLEIVAALVRDAEKTREVPIPLSRVTVDPAEVIEHPEIEVVVELIGGATDALLFVKRASTPARTSSPPTRPCSRTMARNSSNTLDAEAAPSPSRRVSAAASRSSRPSASRSPPIKSADWLRS